MFIFTKKKCTAQITLIICLKRNNHTGDLDAQFMKERICNGRGQNYHKVKYHKIKKTLPLMQFLLNKNLGLHWRFWESNESCWIKNFAINEDSFTIKIFLNLVRIGLKNYVENKVSESRILCLDGRYQRLFVLQGFFFLFRKRLSRRCVHVFRAAFNWKQLPL